MRRLFVIGVFLLTVRTTSAEKTVRIPPPEDVDTQMLAQVERRLTTIVIPEFSVTNMPLRDAVNVLVDTSMQHDPDDIGLSLIVNLTNPTQSDSNDFASDVTPATLTIRLKDVTYADILDAMCRELELVWQMTPVPMILHPDNAKRIKQRKSVHQWPAAGRETSSRP